MNLRFWSALRLHEWAFGLFLLITSVRLLAAGAYGLGLAFAGMATTVPLMVYAATRWSGLLTARVRLGLFPVWINLVYPLLGAAVVRLGLGPRDELLEKWDIALFGVTPAKALSGWNHSAVTDFLSACYLLFFPAVLAAFLVALRCPRNAGVRLFNGLVTIYAIGFFGYTLIPASGPHLAMAGEIPQPREGGMLTRLNAGLVLKGSNRVDVFPSLHTAVTVFLMGLLWLRCRPWFWLLLIPAAGLCSATLYLGYHYAVDLAAGLLLAACGLLLATNSLPSYEPTHPRV